MKVEMICTGEEVLSGQIVDTNAAWVANELMAKGVELQRRVTVGDRVADLAAAFIECSQRADLVIVNGGLGPTADDLSAVAMAQALDAPLQESTHWRAELEARFLKRGKPMPISNLKQCLLPEGSVLVDNPVGTACGFRVLANGCWLFFTPGVPSEFKVMVREQLLPFIAAEWGMPESVVLEKLLCFGHGESAIADRLDPLALPDGMTIGYRSTMPYIEVKLFARGAEAHTQLPQFMQQVRTQLGNACIGHNSPSLAVEVHRLLQEKEASLSLAESCTGGLLASSLVELAGSSHYLQQSVVSYSNAAKIKLLGVSPETLDQEGAVSLAVAQQMAEGVRGLLDSDYALATTGIAGPDGGSDEKPVGTVVIALSAPSGCYLQQVQLAGRSRNLVRLLSVAVALDMLRRALEGEEPIVDYPNITRSALIEPAVRSID